MINSIIKWNKKLNKQRMKSQKLKKKPKSLALMGRHKPAFKN